MSSDPVSRSPAHPLIDRAQVGARLRVIRKNQKLTLKQLSERSGVALSTLLVVAGVPRVLVPAAFGVIADTASVATAFFCLGLIMAAMAGLALTLQRLQNR